MCELPESGSIYNYAFSVLRLVKCVCETASYICLKLLDEKTEDEEKFFVLTFLSLSYVLGPSHKNL